jgi:hypothetical protein
MDINTIEHARLLIALADPDAGLTEKYQSFLKSPPRKATDDDFYAWSLTQIKNLYGVDSFRDAFQNHDFRTLLAFGYMGYAQHLDLSLPRVTRSMPVPKIASGIEPDFFPVLLKEIRAYAASSATFAQNLEASTQSVSNLVARLSATPPEAAPGAAVAHTAADNVEGLINVVAFVGFLIWATVSLGDKKKN